MKGLQNLLLVSKLSFNADLNGPLLAALQVFKALCCDISKLMFVQVFCCFCLFFIHMILLFSDSYWSCAAD